MVLICPMKKIYRIFLVLFLLVLVVLATYFLTRPSHAVSFLLSPNKFTLKSGETIESSVILGGPVSLVKGISVVDVKINYDTSKLAIVSFSAGPFFTYPMIVKSDMETGLFSLATSPGTKGQVSLNSSNRAEILKITFQAISPAKNSKISFDTRTSSVYISGTGTPRMMFSPATVTIN
jgi:hypothetical protein